MAKGIRLTDRDIEILALLGEVWYLDTDTIRQRFWDSATSDEACTKRLRSLLGAKLIVSHKPEINSRKDGKAGKQTYIHQLTALGADEVNQRTGKRPERYARSDAPQQETIQHHAGVARTRLAFDDAFAAAKLAVPDWIHERDMNPGVPEGAKNYERYKLVEVFNVGGKRVTFGPDAAARFRIESGSAWELLAYLEYDRSTMSHEDIEKKLWGYHGFYRAGAWRRHWSPLGRHAAFILFVCISHRRIDELLANEKISKHPVAKHCRFAVESDLKQDNMLWESIWMTVDGELRPLLKSPTPAAKDA